VYLLPKRPDDRKLTFGMDWIWTGRRDDLLDDVRYAANAQPRFGRELRERRHVARHQGTLGRWREANSLKPGVASTDRPPTGGAPAGAASAALGM